MIGIATWLLLPPPRNDPLRSKIPITEKVRPSTRIVSPIGSLNGKSVSATSGPITATCAACLRSASVKKRPSATQWTLACM